MSEVTIVNLEAEKYQRVASKEDFNSAFSEFRDLTVGEKVRIVEVDAEGSPTGSVIARTVTGKASMGDNPIVEFTKG